MKEASVSEQLHGFVDDLEESLSFDPGMTFDCDAVLLCGVGGSAVSGDFAADCCFTESRVPIRLMKYPDIPSWAGPRTLAVVSSYSGNTAETLEMRRQAKARGCAIVSITSGGALAEVSESEGEPVFRLPTGMQPRHAIGFMIGYTLAVIRAAGGPDLSDRIRSFIPALRGYRDEVSSGDGCQARFIADRFEGKVPVVCSGPGLRSAAFRWKTQINENAKFVAFCEYGPEFVRHGLRAWSETVRGDFVMLLLMGQPSDGMGMVSSQLAASEADALVVRLGGDTELEDMFRAIILGDYVSMFMAQARGIDPAEVRPVKQLKEKLGQPRRAVRGLPRTPL